MAIGSCIIYLQLFRREVIYLPEESTSTSAPTVVSKNDSNILAAISYLWILSIVMLFVKKDDDFVVFHAKQGTVLFGAWAVVAIVGIPFLFLGPLILLIDLVIFIAVIIGFIQAISGKRYKMPVVSNLAEKINI